MRTLPLIREQYPVMRDTRGCSCIYIVVLVSQSDLYLRAVGALINSTVAAVIGQTWRTPDHQGRRCDQVAMADSLCGCYSARQQALLCKTAVFAVVTSILPLIGRLNTISFPSGKMAFGNEPGASRFGKLVDHTLSVALAMIISMPADMQILAASSFIWKPPVP